MLVLIYIYIYYVSSSIELAKNISRSETDRSYLIYSASGS